jgi:hypothetical protein
VQGGEEAIDPREGRGGVGRRWRVERKRKGEVVAGKAAAATHWREELAAGRTEGGVAATCCRPAEASRLTPNGKEEEERRGAAPGGI